MIRQFGLFVLLKDRPETVLQKNGAAVNAQRLQVYIADSTEMLQV